MAIWTPHVTVAAVIERAGQFLLVEEDAGEGIQLNQPAGHWEQGETLLQAVCRETLEESAWHFEPTHLVGIYTWHHLLLKRTYLRFAFCGELLSHEPQRVLDEGILGVRWLSPSAIADSTARHRSPLVWECVRDYLAGQRYPLSVLLNS